jgi:hypothetical protein
MKKTPDGASVHIAEAMPTRKGPLVRDTPLDNSEAFGTTGTKGTRALNGAISSMESLMESQKLDIPGFDAEARYLVKHGTPFGELALFNQLPPGMDIDDQNYVLINEMPLKMVTEIGYPGDGGFPVRDVKE